MQFSYSFQDSEGNTEELDIIVSKCPPQATGTAPSSPGVGGNNLTYVIEVKTKGAVARDGRIGVGDILVAVKNSPTQSTKESGTIANIPVIYLLTCMK